MAASPAFEQLVVNLVPSLSRSLAERFNVFRVMHHGTHEKQLSNVFAWLLSSDATHDLGDAFQQIFVRRLLEHPSLAGSALPTAGYEVAQEVDTAGHEGLGRDIADIVLTTSGARIVIENFESSDGHGHDYQRYHAYGQAGGRQSVVVLLCARHEPHRQVKGWQHAVVVTYDELLVELQRCIAGDASWRRAHPEQQFFITQLIEHFVKGTGAVDDGDRITFIRTMCETGESARYGYRPQETAAQEFAELLAQHARHQFEEGRATLGMVKRALKSYAEHTLKAQLAEALDRGRVASVNARFVGRWEWCITLDREDQKPRVFLEFGPTAVVENDRAPERLAAPDYSKVFVTRLAPGGIDRIVQTSVGLDEVLAGLSAKDTRLRDAVLSVARDTQSNRP